MIQVVLVIHLLLAIAIIGLILLQRSEGGGLGLGSSGGLGSFATPQATASAMTRVTWACAAGFFVTSLVLGVLYNHTSSKNNILDRLDQAAVTAPAVAGSEEKTDTSKANSKTNAKAPAAKKSEPTVPVTP